MKSADYFSIFLTNFIAQKRKYFIFYAANIIKARKFYDDPVNISNIKNFVKKELIIVIFNKL